ncbi:MAG: GNAT family N-acetyltransferase [Halobacteriaceae archaeon]
MPAANARVDLATSDDVDAMTRLWVDLVDDQRRHGAHLYAEPNRETARGFVSQYVYADQLAVARADDRVVGFVMFHVETGAYDQDCSRGVVDNVFVDPEYRNGGVGSLLLDAAESSLSDAGADVVSLSVLASNEAARRLYEAHGYEPHRLEMEKPIESDTLSSEDG